MSAFDLKAIGYYVDIATAETTRMALEASGIEAILQKDDGGGIYHIHMATGIQILVRSEDYDKAEEIISESEQKSNKIDNAYSAVIDSLFNDGVKLYEQRKFDEAEIKLKEALNIVPANYSNSVNEQ